MHLASTAPRAKNLSENRVWPGISPGQPEVLGGPQEYSTTIRDRSVRKNAMRRMTSVRRITALAAWFVTAGLALLAAPQRSFAVAWNATDPTFSAVSVNGL